MARRPLFVSGTRADFGKVDPLARGAGCGLRCDVLRHRQALLDRYGLTKLKVHRTPGIAVHDFVSQRSGDPQDLIVAKTITGFSDYVTEHRPDLVVVHGDRVEALATALVTATS